MIVVIDANIVVANPNLNSDIWEHLRKAVTRKRVRVFMPEIVVEEAVANRRKQLKTLGKKLREEAIHAPAEVFELVAQAQAEALRIADNYEKTLQERWADLGFEVAPTSNAAHRDVARRAINRRRPFNDQGGGYRDTLHWLTLIDLAAQSPKEDFVLLTEDGIFSTNQDTLPAELVKEFEAVNMATIKLCRKLSDLVIPGHFITDPTDAPGYEVSLRTAMMELFNSEYALHKIRSPGIGVPHSDWDELVDVTDLKFTVLTSRQVEQQARPEIHFSATAAFIVEGTYVDDESDTPMASTQTIKMSVEISGNATTLDAMEIGVLRDVQATLLSDDPYLVEAVRNAGKHGLRPMMRDDLEHTFGSEAVLRIEDEYRRSWH